MESVLPKFILLKQNGNNKYLHYRPLNKEKGLNDSSLHFTNYVKNHKVEHLAHESNKTDQSSESEKTYQFSWNCLRFEVEKAKTVEGFVHIRTSYNNKYWVRKSEESNVIVAEADEPEEDLSKWSCTLFKPIFMEADTGTTTTTKVTNEMEKKLRLLHAGQRYIYTSALSSTLLGLGNAGHNDDDGDDQFEQLVTGYLDGHLNSTESISAKSTSSVFTVIDVALTAQLPSYFTIMGNNEKYLVAPTTSSSTSGYFSTSDIGVAGVPHTTLVFLSPSDPQILLIQSRARSAFWTHTLLPIFHINVSYEPLSDRTMRCVPVNVGNYIAFRNRHKTYVSCHRSNNQLVCDTRSTTITENAMFKIGEPVLQREIIDATYDLDNARVYNIASTDLYTDSRTNNSDVDQTGTFGVDYTESKTMKWNHSVTVNIGISVTWSKGIPFVGNLGVEVSYGRSETWDWGEEKKEEKSVKYTQNLNLPAMSKVTLRVVATRASCDVPFTCRVRDVMTDGTSREYTMFDCWFVGGNEFGIHTVIDKEPV